jgi:hypothetical protein
MCSFSASVAHLRAAADTEQWHNADSTRRSSASDSHDRVGRDQSEGEHTHTHARVQLHRLLRFHMLMQ